MDEATTRALERRRIYTYILLCADKSLYTGWTKDLTRRLQQHQAGKASKYTRARLPVKLVYKEELLSQKEAMQREYQIKQLTRSQKQTLIAGL